MRDTSTTETIRKTFNVAKLAAALFRRKGLIAFVFCVVLGIAAATTLLLPRRYESSMKLLVKSQRADLVVSPDARDSSYVHNEVTESQVNSEIELLGSYDLLAKVVKACHLYRSEPGARLDTEKKGELFETAIRKLKRDLKIAPVRKSNFIEVTYSAESPQLAAAVLQELSSAYLDMHLRIHRSAGTQDFFRRQANRYGTQLHEAAERLNEFCRKNGFTSVDEQKNLLVRKLLDSETELKEAGTSLAETSRRVVELRKQLDAQTPRLVTQSRSVPNQYSIERLNTMLAELQNRRTETLVKFRPDDRMVVELNEQIANTRAAMEKASKLMSTEQVTDLNPLHTAIESDLAREERNEAGLRVRHDNLAAIVTGYRTRIGQLEGNTLEYDSLQRTVKESEENYLLYTRKQEEARIADSLDQQKMANVAVAEAPVEHYLPTEPKVALSLILGALLAVIVSLGVGLAVEYGGGRLYTPEEVESTTGVPVLVTVGWKKA